MCTVLPRHATSVGIPTLTETNLAVTTSDEWFTTVHLQGRAGQKCVGEGEQYRLGHILDRADASRRVGGTDMREIVTLAVVAGFRMWSADAATDFLRSRKLVGLVLMAIGVYAMAGIRAYFSGFMIAGIAAATAWMAAAAGPLSARLRTLALNAALLVVLWMMFAAGGGPYYRDYMRFARNTVLGPDSAIDALDLARNSFIATGGATSFAPIPSVDERLDGFETRAHGPGWKARIRATLTGCLVIVVPVSILRALSIVTFSGGRGLLMITDLDTLVIDVTVLACILWTVWLGRGRRTLDPALLFAVVLAAMTCLALAYVVTNFGTLFRLRLLVAAPLWVIPVLRLRSREATPTITPASIHVP